MSGTCNYHHAVLAPVLSRLPDDVLARITAEFIRQCCASPRSTRA